MATISPKVSVIIPTYNCEEFIGSAIQSVLAQTWTNFEIIVIDDGSTDKSQLLVQSLIHLHSDKIIYLYQSNQGVSVAKNAGLKIATGDLIAFLDADDYWLPDKLSKQVSIFKEFPEVGFCCSDFINLTPLDEKSQFNSIIEMNNFEYGRVLSNNTILEKLFKFNFLGTLTVVLRKSLVGQVGVFKSEFKQSEDYDYWLRCALVTNFFVIKIPLAIRRLHASNLTGNYLITAQYHEKVLVNFFINNKDYLVRNKLLPVIQDGLADTNYLIGNMKFEEGKTCEAFSNYCRGLLNKLTFNNFYKFLGVTSRKLIRILSFNLISRKRMLR